MYELLPLPLQEALMKNGQNHGEDYVPLAMLKIEGALQIWLLTELEPDAPHIGWGICDHSVGAPYYGWVSLVRIEYKYWDQWRLKAVWDENFEGHYPCSVYLHAAENRIRNGKLYSGVTLDPTELAQAAAELNAQPQLPPHQKPPGLKP